MPTFIQLHRNIGYAVVSASGEVDHTVTPDHVTAIQYDGENPDQFINKEYNPENKTWSDAPLIYWAVVNSEGRIIEVNKTYFIDEVNGPILPEGVQTNWQYVNNEWVEPIRHVASIIVDSEQPAIESSLNENSPTEENTN